MVGPMAAGLRIRFAAQEVGLEVGVELAEIMPEAGIVGEFGTAEPDRELLSGLSNRPQMGDEIMAEADPIG